MATPQNPRPPQFSLRHLLVLVSICAVGSCIFAYIRRPPPARESRVGFWHIQRTDNQIGFLVQHYNYSSAWGMEIWDAEPLGDPDRIDWKHEFTVEGADLLANREFCEWYQQICQ